jgi:predicted transcriptional regulator
VVLSNLPALEGANSDSPTHHWAELTADMVSAYVSHNSLSASDLPAFIHSVYATLFRFNLPPAAMTEKLIPEAPINTRLYRGP